MIRRLLYLTAAALAVLLVACHSTRDTQSTAHSHTTAADTASLHIRATDYTAALRLTVATADSVHLTLTADSVRHPDGTVIYGPRLGRRDYRPATSAALTAAAGGTTDARAESGHHAERDSTASRQSHAEHRAMHPPDWLAMVLALVLVAAAAVILLRTKE